MAKDAYKGHKAGSLRGEMRRAFDTAGGNAENREAAARKAGLKITDNERSIGTILSFLRAGSMNPGAAKAPRGKKAVKRPVKKSGGKPAVKAPARKAGKPAVARARLGTAKPAVKRERLSASA